MHKSQVFNFICPVVMRFPHWVASKRIGKKIRFNPNLNLKPAEKMPREHDYIVFKNYTGNEILYSLKHSNELAPSELSSALLEIGLKKGAPEGTDWNTHPRIQEVVSIIKKRAPQYTCRVLTSLAHALDRLNINDQALWSALSQHIIRTSSTIQPIGLAYSFHAFIGKNTPEFYEKMLEIINLHIRYMNGRDLLNIAKGLIHSNIPANDLFSNWIYPLLKEKKKMCSSVQLQQYLEILSKRNDFTPELQKILQDTIEYKAERLKNLELYGKPKLNPKEKLNPPIIN
jgi:hypothetical protein